MKKLILDSTRRMRRLALVEDGVLTELVIECNKNRQVLGNIYRGRVANVLKAINTAFVEISKNQNGYYNFGEDKNIKPGMEITVQVSKEAIGDKCAVVTDKLGIPGKFIVLIRGNTSVGISKKITDESERARIKEIIEKILPAHYGVIVRTNGEGRTEKEFSEEILSLQGIFDTLGQKENYIKAPALLYKEKREIDKTIRDLFNDDIDEFIINQEDEYKEYLSLFPHHPALRLYTESIPLFENYFLESQIDKALRKKVWLRCGGFILIEETETLVLIDVNTGKNQGKKNINNTFLSTNIEACIEIAKQIRLRNLHGIIIIDFIDLKCEQDKKRLIQTLEREIKKDRITTVVIGATELNLMQLTRKKTRETLKNQVLSKCPRCNGNGYLCGKEYIAAKIERQIATISAQTIFKTITVHAGKEILDELAGKDGENKLYLEKKYEKEIILNPVSKHFDDYFLIEKNR